MLWLLLAGVCLVCAAALGFAALVAWVRWRLDERRRRRGRELVRLERAQATERARRQIRLHVVPAPHDGVAEATDVLVREIELAIDAYRAGESSVTGMLGQLEDAVHDYRHSLG